MPLRRSNQKVHWMLVCRGAAHIDLEKVTERIQWAGWGWERPEAASGRLGSFPGLAAHKPHSYLYRRSLKIESKWKQILRRSSSWLDFYFPQQQIHRKRRASRITQSSLSQSSGAPRRWPCSPRGGWEEPTHHLGITSGGGPSGFKQPPPSCRLYPKSGTSFCMCHDREKTR